MQIFFAILSISKTFLPKTGSQLPLDNQEPVITRDIFSLVAYPPIKWRVSSNTCSAKCQLQRWNYILFISNVLDVGPILMIK